MQYSENLCTSDITVKDALKLLDKLKDKIVFIQNSEFEIIGTLTDGDVRRGLLKELNLGANIMEFAQKEFSAIKQNDLTPNLLNDYRKKGIFLIPLLNSDDKLVDIINLKEVKSYLPLDAIIMAGGLGSRLLPLTKNLPKPMLTIGNKPIIEYNLDLLKSFGIKNVGISVRYLAEKIIEHYKNGESRGQKINYIKEDEPLGTIGAAKLFTAYENEFVLIMNSDLLTNINLSDMFQELLDHDADMIVACTEYKVNVPYGVVETDQSVITGLKEKPTYTYYSNAGIYILKRSILEQIPEKEHFNATDLIDTLIQKKQKIVNYPIRGYWLDIGKKQDFERAQIDVEKINFN